LTPATGLSTELIEEFRRIDCASVADATRNLGLNGIVQGLYPVAPSSKICGRAVTMRQVPLQDPKAWDHSGTDVASLISICEPGDVIVVDAGDGLTSPSSVAGRRRSSSVSAWVVLCSTELAGTGRSC